MINILRKIYHTPRIIKNYRLNKISNINYSPIFVLGNQKSGTSAIGALLGELTNKPTTIDLEGLYEPVQSKLHRNEVSFETFLEKNKYDFSNEIIKEPSLTFLYDDIKRIFNTNKNVFIVRDPRDNIRSILNRVDLPGDEENIKESHPQKWKNAPINWKRVIDSRWLGTSGENYIEWMSYRWLKCLDIYEQNSDDFILIRYEDFIKNKKEAIENLAEELSLNIVNDISDKVNIQFQPPGNRKTNQKEFFGKRNLLRVETICNTKMQKYGYDNLWY
ncbi:sulfotransferase domain-containing protein [Virgibacillus sp. JSM 102003]|uniref:sulfotransferase domain-containing protein n=1 Tax=Virgibacillus sp. JSM 102003 TaxID=1562108 RepID=UPI0035BF550E